LKHLSSALEKNELLIFNGKALDYLYEGSALFTNAPLLRFLLSGRNIRDDCRTYGVQSDRVAVRALGQWACRSLQEVVTDFAGRLSTNGVPPVAVSRRAREVLDMQEQIGPEVLDALEDRFPDWVNEVAQDVWDTVGGW
jgi:hypothetical protein